MGQVTKLKRTWNLPKLFKRLLKIIVLAYIYQLGKFGDFMICGSKYILKNAHLVSCTNTYRDVTDLVNHATVKNTKTWISWERSIVFLQNKKILNLCFRWHIFRRYCFVAEVTFNEHKFQGPQELISSKNLACKAVASVLYSTHHREQKVLVNASHVSRHWQKFSVLAL